jgi:hypothetical protein
MPINAEGWLKRANDLLAQPMGNVSGTEMVQFATSMLTTLHGGESIQVKAFLDRCAAISKNSSSQSNAAFYLLGHAQGAVKNAVAEVEGGLITSLRVLVAGEILSELVRLGKEILQEHTDAAKNVAAVLIAAAYEDLLRRMAEEFAGASSKLSLQDATTALKNAGVFRGGEVGTAQSFLKFRNDSLHADWANVSRAEVESCTAFIEAMLVKHFS